MPHAGTAGTVGRGCPELGSRHSAEPAHRLQQRLCAGEVDEVAVGHDRQRVVFGAREEVRVVAAGDDPQRAVLSTRGGAVSSQKVMGALS
jgi:hypothetical protein